jgi:hypothetical protein
MTVIMLKMARWISRDLSPDFSFALTGHCVGLIGNAGSLKSARYEMPGADDNK